LLNFNPQLPGSANDYGLGGVAVLSDAGGVLLGGGGGVGSGAGGGDGGAGSGALELEPLELDPEL